MRQKKNTKIYPDSVTAYNNWPGNEAGLFDSSKAGSQHGTELDHATLRAIAVFCSVDLSNRDGRTYVQLNATKLATHWNDAIPQPQNMAWQ